MVLVLWLTAVGAVYAYWVQNEHLCCRVHPVSLLNIPTAEVAMNTLGGVSAVSTRLASKAVVETRESCTSFLTLAVHRNEGTLKKGFPAMLMTAVTPLGSRCCLSSLQVMEGSPWREPTERLTRVTLCPLWVKDFARLRPTKPLPPPSKTWCAMLTGRCSDHGTSPSCRSCMGVAKPTPVAERGSCDTIRFK